MKDFVRSTYWSQEVHIDNKFISATNFLVYTMGGRKNRPTVQLITLLIVAMGRRVVVANSLSDFVYQRSLEEVSSIIGLFIQRYFRATLTWKLIDFYWHN